MNTIALYIGYVILGILGLALLVLVILVLWLTVAAFYRIIKTKQTIRFMCKYENKVAYDAMKTALQYLLSKGASRNDTLETVESLIEKFRKINRIE